MSAYTRMCVHPTGAAMNVHLHRGAPEIAGWVRVPRGFSRVLLMGQVPVRAGGVGGWVPGSGAVYILHFSHFHGPYMRNKV